MFCLAESCWSCWSGDSSTKGENINNLDEEGEDIYDFGLCPHSHRYAFHYGQKCCSEFSSWSDSSCEGDTIDCNSSTCEERYPCCVPRRSGECYSRESFRIENLSPEYDGIYESTSRLEANRPIYNGLNEREEECMWWHLPTRHWWIGKCEDIGENVGYAYIDEDLSCPTYCIREVIEETSSCTEKLPTWKSGDSNEIINGAKIITNPGKIYPSGSAAEPTYEATSSAGVNSIIQDTRYRQRCRFKRRNGVYVCVKKSN